VLFPELRIVGEGHGDGADRDDDTVIFADFE